MSPQAKNTNIITDEQLEDLLSSRGSTDPVPILKHRSEDRILRELKQVALKGCDDIVADLARCTEGKLFSVVWKCRQHKRAVDECLRGFSKDDALKNEMRRRCVACQLML